jgi:sucrose synthase
LSETLRDLISTHRTAIYPFFRRLHDLDAAIANASEVSREYSQFVETETGAPLRGTEFDRLVACTQEVVKVDNLLLLALRTRVAQWQYLEVHTEEMRYRVITVSEYLDFKERLVARSPSERDHALEIDLGPFERGFPRLTQARSIGRGVEFLNRFLSGRLFQQDADGLGRLLEFLRAHEVHGQPLMLNGHISELPELRQRLREGVDILKTLDAEDEDWLKALRPMGFEPGWGRTPTLALEMMELLLDILEAPDPRHLQAFLARIPMITSIAILSPHGYFGQSDVLGKPDTGGQVVYILDQVRALEQAMRESLHQQGLDIEPQVVVVTRLIPEADGTSCDVRLEPVIGTKHARILRVPFRTATGDVVRPWVSRFKIWPYLERFAMDAERELLAELGRHPDFILGNYSDGNLVASLMARRLGVTQCNIAHALEKTKYPNSDLHWRAQESEYHFACQFTADLIAMNTADFIIASTYQEIAGTDHSVGQYESYQSYTMPGLYRVVSGIDCFDPKFNIVSPGANPDVFFPFWESGKRIDSLTEDVRTLVFGPADDARGNFEDPTKPLLLAISRLDQIKNMGGLLEWYGQSADLRERANLVIVGGWIDPDDSQAADERAQATRIHELMDKYALDGHVRWIAMQTSKNLVGELYRVVADSKGAFVQPALYEAFGLTVIEAMVSGLPVFVTRHGGPAEIVEDGISGFHIDPFAGAEAAARMADFLERAAADPDVWTTVSDRAVSRVEERYNWPLYASRLLELSRIYGFWKYITSLERDETRRYLEMFYSLMYRPLAASVEPQDS